MAGAISKLLGSKYTDEQIQFIKKMKEEERLPWEKAVEKYNKKFNPVPLKTVDAIRKIYAKYGGIDFNDDAFIQNVKSAYIAKRRNSRLAKENKMIIGEVVTLDEIKDVFEDLLNKVQFKLHKPIKKTKNSNKKTDRTLVAHLSDTHYGNNISKNEMGGINSYSNCIAARRTALFFKNISQFKPQYRSHTDLVLVLNGDLATGIIHDQEHAVDLMTKQFATLLSIIGQGVSYLAQHFNKITVYCTAGNHMRFMHKRSKSRAVANKWDSFATMAYISLQREFTSYKNISFVIPESPYAIFDVQGRRAFATHGDSVFQVGNPSKVVKIGDIAAQVDRINNSELARKKKIGLFFVAHVHTPMVVLLDNGSYVYINGCLSGLDSFGQSIGIFGNNPTQQLLEVTKDHVGDCRLVCVKEADEDASLDKIIDWKSNQLFEES